MSEPKPTPDGHKESDQVFFAFRLVAVLLQDGIDVTDVAPREHDLMVRLGCGAVIFVYSRTGKTMVQGRVCGKSGRYVLFRLRRLLPTATIWRVHADN
jgi:hypothetical protein